MSFLTYKEVIEDGDTVILYFGFDNMHQIRVQKDKVHQTRYGALKHNDLMGKRFGGKFNCSKGWLYALYPTPELWTLTLPHRTQILYSRDISAVTLQLDLKPGSVVIESGTGSASLSHAIIRSIAPTGHLYTFDFHEQRCETARQEFKEHGIGDLVTCTHRDVCASGFDMEDTADAVFLDLPAPWSVVPFVEKALKKRGGRMCSFSPCIEQVQRVCDALKRGGFCEITTMECLARPFDVRTVNMPLPDLGWGPGKCCDFDDVGGSFHSAVIGKIEDSQVAMEDSCRVTDNDACDPSDRGDQNAQPKATGKAEGTERPLKKIKTGSKGGKRRQTKERASSAGPSFVFKTGLVPTQIPGHTGYLTFASLYPQ